MLFLLPTALCLTWVSAVDLDVHRVPFKATLGGGALVLSLAAIAAVWRGDPSLLLSGALGSAAVWALITRPAGRTAYAPWLAAGWVVAVVALSP